MGSSEIIHRDTPKAQISQKQDEHNVYVLSWKQCAFPVITKMALWQLMHLGKLNWDMLNKLQRITFFLSNCLKFSEISYSRTLAKSSSDRFRVYLSSLALLVELICKGAYDYHYHRHSNHYHHQHCRYHKQ